MHGGSGAPCAGGSCAAGGAAASCSASTSAASADGQQWLKIQSFSECSPEPALLHSHGPCGALGGEVAGSSWQLAVAGARAAALDRAPLCTDFVFG